MNPEHPKIPVCHLCIIWWPWRDTSSSEVGRNCAKLEGTASEVAMIVQHSDGVCPPGELLPPWLNYSGSLRLTLSLSLAKKSFSLQNLGKNSEPSTAVKTGNLRNRGQPGAYTGLPMLWGRSLKPQCTKAFFHLNS
jgi:hypothetical protein